MQALDLCGVKINNLSKNEFLDEIERLVDTKTPSYIVTPYSEFIINAQKDLEFKKILNESDVSTADGIGILIGLRYFSLNGVYWPLIKCLLAAIFNRSYLHDVVKAKLSGSEFVYDICNLAAEEGFKVFFLGGYDFGGGNSGVIASEKLKKRFPKLQVAGHHSGSADAKVEDEIIKIVNNSQADILLIAYGPVKQEKWANRNKLKLNPMLSVCVGGTFDYIAGSKKQVPKFLRDRGLEGILRPFISERGNIKLIFRRINRGWVGIVKFLGVLVKEKKRYSSNS